MATGEFPDDGLWKNAGGHILEVCQWTVEKTTLPSQNPTGKLDTRDPSEVTPMSAKYKKKLCLDNKAGKYVKSYRLEGGGDLPVKRYTEGYGESLRFTTFGLW